MLPCTDKNSSAAKAMQPEFRGTSWVLEQDVCTLFSTPDGRHGAIKSGEKENSYLTTPSNNVWLHRAHKALCTISKQTFKQAEWQFSSLGCK